MTPEQIDRTIQFIINHQAQAASHIEQLAARTLSMESLFVTMTELVQIQSRRLDRHDENFGVVQAQNEECLVRLDRILDRLKDKT